MIEEAAGTTMYESKKQSALRTMEKKESKLSEFEKVISSFKFTYAIFSVNVLLFVGFMELHTVPVAYL